MVPRSSMQSKEAGELRKACSGTYAHIPCLPPRESTTAAAPLRPKLKTARGPKRNLADVSAKISSPTALRSPRSVLCRRGQLENAHKKSQFTCVFAHVLMQCFPHITHPPDVLFLDRRQPAQFESVNTEKQAGLSCQLKCWTALGLPKRYLPIRLTAPQSLKRGELIRRLHSLLAN